MANGHGERPRLRRPRVNHDPAADGADQRAVGVVELDALVGLEVAAHRRAVPVGLVDEAVVVEGDRPLEPGGAGRRGRLRCAREPAGALVAGSAVVHRADAAERAAPVVEPRQRREAGVPALAEGDDSVGAHGHGHRPAERREEDPGPGAGDAPDVFVRQDGEDAVGGPARRRPGRVDEGGPVLAAISGELHPVGGPDVGRLAADHDPGRRHILPLGSELAEFPVAPAAPAVSGHAPSVAHRAVPDFPAAAERDRMHEVPRQRRGRRVAADLLPGDPAGRQDINALAVRARPDSARRVAGEREDVDAPAGGIGQGRKRALRERRHRKESEAEHHPSSWLHEVHHGKVGSARLRQARAGASRAGHGAAAWRQRPRRRPRRRDAASVRGG